MKLHTIILSASLLFTLGSFSVFADTFDFSFGTSSNGFSGTGQFVANLTSPGVYTITSVSGTSNTGGGNNQNIAGIEAAGAFEGNDNLLDDNGGVYNFDGFGLSYDLANGAQIHISLGLTGDAEILERVNHTLGAEAVAYTITDVTTPEPGSLLLLGAGLLCTFGVMRRRLSA